MEVARAAVELFLAKGVAATSAEEIAAAAGISSRTLWRYFPTKESCVTPLLTGVVELIAGFLESWPSDQTMAGVFDTIGLHDNVADRTTMVQLVRLTRTEPGLRAVWLEAHRHAEPAFAEALARRAGLPTPDLTVTVQAAMIHTALRVAAEYYAFNADHPDAETSDYEAAMRKALLIAERTFA
ncbi:TetR/AcrR family transcriptional regulator [Kribbella sp. NPDC055071]